MALNMDLLGAREGEEEIFAREALIFEEELKAKRAGRKWKRSHITTARVLDVYSRPHEERWPVDEVLQAETGAPFKVVWAAMWREEERGFVDYGTNLRGGWLTSKGKTKLSEIMEKTHPNL